MQAVKTYEPTIAQDRETIVQACLESEAFKAEVIYAERGGHYTVSRDVRLFKVLEDDMLRVVFPVQCGNLEVGSVLAITCLYDTKENYNIYGHTICAGPGVNTLLKSIHAPLGSAHPQPGVLGEKAILRFVAWKEAAWSKFMTEDLDLGSAAASELFVRDFWKALDRMFGGGTLFNCPDDYHWDGR